MVPTISSGSKQCTVHSVIDLVLKIIISLTILKWKPLFGFAVASKARFLQLSPYFRRHSISWFHLSVTPYDFCVLVLLSKNKKVAASGLLVPVLL